MRNLSFGLGFTPAQNATTGSPPPSPTYYIELEGVTDDLLMETGDHLLTEDAP